MSAGSEEQRAVRVLALGEQIHLCSPLTLAVSNHPNRLGVQSPLSLRNPLPRKHVRPSDQETGDVRSSDEEEDSPLPACTAPLSKFLSGDLYTKPQTCCRCESVHAAVPTVAENPLELRRLFPAPGGLCATGSEIPATVPRLAFPRTLLPSRESMHPIVTITRDATWAQGNSPAEEIWVASELRCGRDVQTSRSPRRPQTRDFSHSCSGRICNNPRWHTAESAALSPSSLWKSFNWTELPCLKRRREDKLAADQSRERQASISTRSHERQALIPTRSQREAGSHPHAI